MKDFVVVDVETTGLGKADRVVEIAAVVVNGTTLQIEDEFDTLINPLRDVGPTAIHGITASMVEMAPTFDEISIALGNVLSDRILVAHNISFDKRFIRNEYERLGVDFESGYGVCTLALTHEKLAQACHRRAIELSHAHRALSDARATAHLLTTLVEEVGEVSPIAISGLEGDWKTMTLRREAFATDNQATIVRQFRTLRFPTSDGVLISYLDVLDSYLDDFVLTESEKSSLQDYARELEINELLIPELHWAYLQSIVHAAQRDGRITEFEHEVMTRIATALDLPTDDIPAISQKQTVPSSLNGLRVCFTGEPVVNGQVIARSTLESLAANAGLQPVQNVTKSGCDLLVAADASSMSGKAGKAIKFEIPILSVADFLIRIGN